MVVRTRHVFMCCKEQPADMHGFLVVFILLSVEKKCHFHFFFYSYVQQLIASTVAPY